MLLVRIVVEIDRLEPIVNGRLVVIGRHDRTGHTVYINQGCGFRQKVAVIVPQVRPRMIFTIVVGLDVTQTVVSPRFSLILLIGE